MIEFAQRPPMVCTVCAALMLGMACTPQDARLTSLIETERRFAATSASEGMNAAFLEFLSDDAVLFRPHPVNGKQFTLGQDEPPLVLTWQPTRASVSRAGDLGYTSGPYVVTLDDGDEPPIHGYFVSVWKRPPGGEWRVAVDLGTENPEHESCAETESFSVPTDATPPAQIDPIAEAAALVEVEREIGIDGDAEALVRLAERLGERARLYRDRHCPVEGAVAVRWALDDRPTSMSWQPIAATVAASGDLAYSYGSYVLRARFGENDPVETGYYVRVWSRQNAEPWQLVLDVTSPIPDAE